MTTRKKIVLGTFVALIPLGLFAHDGYEGDHDRGKFEREHHNSMSKFEQERVKEANYEFEGKVEKLPTKGFNGTWMISGKEVIVSDKTYIFQEESKIRIGDEVYIIAKRDGGKIFALSLEQDD